MKDIRKLSGIARIKGRIKNYKIHRAKFTSRIKNLTKRRNRLNNRIEKLKAQLVRRRLSEKLAKMPLSKQKALLNVSNNGSSKHSKR